MSDKRPHQHYQSGIIFIPEITINVSVYIIYCYCQRKLNRASLMWMARFKIISLGFTTAVFKSNAANIYDVNMKFNAVSTKL